MTRSGGDLSFQFGFETGLQAAAEFANRIFSWQLAAQLVLLVVALLAMPWIVAAMAGGRGW